MKISRELALKILKYLLDNEKFEFPFNILCKSIDGSDNFVEVIPKYDYEILIKTEKYNDFKLCGNLQNLDLETLRLMSQGFIEKNVSKSILDEISALAINYRKSWKEELWESEDSEEFGFNEFIGGKAEAFEECIQIIKKHIMHEHLFVFQK